MPNGGVPGHLVMRTRDGASVIHAAFGEIAVYESAEWELRKSNGKPIAVLDGEESAALASFLSYWLFDTHVGGGPLGKTSANVQFDW